MMGSLIKTTPRLSEVIYFFMLHNFTPASILKYNPIEDLQLGINLFDFIS